MKILVINGPNLNLLGIREPDVYGTDTLEDIENWLDNQSEASSHEINWIQSNHEGELIDQLHNSIGKFDGIIFNPGAYTHYSYALRDAVASIPIPTIEIHLSDINQREGFRKISVIKDKCIGQICGLGKLGYLEALKALTNYI
jgi:3-dehydroquinate dehydratase-2